MVIINRIPNKFRWTNRRNKKILCTDVQGNEQNLIVLRQLAA